MNIETVKIIETHCHVEVEIEGMFFDTDTVIALQKRERLTYALLIDLYGNANRKLVERVKTDKKTNGVLLFYDPRKEGSLKEVVELAEAAPDIVKGVKLFPKRETYPVSTAMLKDIFACAVEHDLVVVSHTESGGAEAGRFRDLMRLFPQAKLILYHAHPAEEAFAVVNANEHVFVDTSAHAWGRDTQSRALREIGKERIVYGIDSPYGFPVDHGVVQPHYRCAAKDLASFYDNDDDVIEHVLWKNASALFGLNF
jgi:predicted TIM-barrel fold metal-dependent hydrolase